MSPSFPSPCSKSCLSYTSKCSGLLYYLYVPCSIIMSHGYPSQHHNAVIWFIPVSASLFLEQKGVCSSLTTNMSPISFLNLCYMIVGEFNQKNVGKVYFWFSTQNWPRVYKLTMRKEYKVVHPLIPCGLCWKHLILCYASNSWTLCCWVGCIMLILCSITI